MKKNKNQYKQAKKGMEEIISFLKSKTNMKPKPQENWEKEFEELWRTKGCYLLEEFVKNLLSQSQTQAEKRGVESFLKQKVNMKHPFFDKIRQEEKAKCLKEYSFDCSKLLKKVKKEIIKEFTEGKRCLNCGEYKMTDRPDLVDYCYSCLEKN